MTRLAIGCSDSVVIVVLYLCSSVSYNDVLILVVRREHWYAKGSSDRAVFTCVLKRYNCQLILAGLLVSQYMNHCAGEQCL